MTEYENAIVAADGEADRGEYKDAYNTLGRALTIGGPSDQECRYKRGVYALRVAQSRLQQFEESPDTGRTLVKAGCWLSRSEAYLRSAGEGASQARRQQIERDLADNQEQQERFRRLCRTSDVELFTSATGFVDG